jgi:hypothetical protein
MPLGSAASDGSSGESISHFAAIRVRVVGQGTLELGVYSQSDVKFKKLVGFVLEKRNRLLPTRIVNFKQQRASFELRTTGSNEYFKINRIVVFGRESDSSHFGA